MGKFIKFLDYTLPTEKELFQVYKELNNRYFNNSIHVDRIRFSKFIADAVYGTLTYGLFMYDIEKGINEIHINKHLLGKYIITPHPWLLEHVMHHEMCHAMMVLNTHSQRHGFYKCEDHGEEFHKLMNLHPTAERGSRILDHLADTVMGETMTEAKRFLKKYPKFKLKKLWLRPAMPLDEFRHVLPDELLAQLDAAKDGMKDFVEGLLSKGGRK